MKKRMKIWFCEDDETLWEMQKESIEEYFPKASITHFLNAGHAARSLGNPDFIIIDVGGVSALGCNVYQLTKWNVDGLVERFPGAIFIITSDLGYYAEAAFNELKKEIQAVSRYTTEYGIGNICDIIKEHEE